MGHFCISISKLFTLVSSIVLADAMGWNEGDRSDNWNPDGGTKAWNNMDSQKGPIGGWDDDPGNTFLKGNAFPGQENSGAKGEGRLEDSIPGTPGQSYPHYDVIPRTSFDCKRFNNPGYYGDIEARCQVFHICQADGRQNSFLCPVGTIFNQQAFVCDWWYNVNCPDSPFHYDLNRNLYQTGAGPQSGGDKGTHRAWSNTGYTSEINLPNWPDSGDQKGSGQMDQPMNRWNGNQENFRGNWNKMHGDPTMPHRNEMGNWKVSNQKMNLDSHQELQKGMDVNMELNMEKGFNHNRKMPPGAAHQWPGDHGSGPQGMGKFPPKQSGKDGSKIKRRRRVRKPMKNNQFAGQVTSRISKSTWSYEKRDRPNSSQMGDMEDKSWNKQDTVEHAHKQNMNNIHPGTHNPQGFGVWQAQGNQQGWKNKHQFDDRNWNEVHANNQQQELQRNQGPRDGFIALHLVNLFDSKGSQDRHDNGDLIWNDNSPNGHNSKPNWN